MVFTTYSHLCKTTMAYQLVLWHYSRQTQELILLGNLPLISMQRGLWRRVLPPLFVLAQYTCSIFTYNCFAPSLQAHAPKPRASRSFERPGGQACCYRSCGRSRCGVSAQSAQARSDDDACLNHRLPPRSGYGLFVFQGAWDETLALLLHLALCRELTDSAMKTLSL
jgi:hypothetical protein